jgi:hypothetical protein
VVRGVAQPVGRGLFVRLDVFRGLGGLPTFSVLDDVPFGYRLTIEEIPVDCVPFTAIADAPEDARMLLAQGPLVSELPRHPLCAACRYAADRQGTRTIRSRPYASPHTSACSSSPEGMKFALRLPWRVRAHRRL